MTEIKLIVTLQVDPNIEGKKFKKSLLKDAAVEAVNNALNFVAANVGFEHELAADVSIGVAGVEVV